MLKNTTYRSASIQQWLVALALFLSIFTFSGLARSTENGLPKTPLTEQVDVQKATVKKKTVFFGLYCRPVAQIALANTHRWAVLAYNSVVGVRYGLLRQIAAGYCTSRFFLYPKTIPQSFKESVNPSA